MASIRQTQSGSFSVQIRRKGHKPFNATFQTLKEANEWVAAKESELTVFSSQAAANETFSNLGMTYCKQVLTGRASQQITLARIEKLSGYLPLHLIEITRNHINDYRLKRLEEVRPVTVRDELQLINRVYRWGYRELIIDPNIYPNPCRNIPIPSGSKPRNKVVTPKELNSLKTELSPVIGAVVEMAYETAMRRSEITKLTRNDLNLEERTLWVLDGKTGDRIVPLTKKAVALLEDALQRCQNQTGRLFPVAPHSVTTAIRRARRKLGLSEDIRLHQMRHTRITAVAKKGFNQPQIMMVSGHRDSRSVQRYTHLNAKDVIDLLD
ncbi:tyrosine-type recombinase/integrase [uncultured Cohaesibacter sp.]|uniref:tyrosine-type recombinase/integrase n=1 Tax=uncultured Cohaesibacter sp. TaxID=1002546 RepID=UPI0029C984E2|nr:tyrosine-type recombinase/integrase [uncultured Cohaesibacter sp.]